MSKNPHSDVTSTFVDRVEMPVPSAGIFDPPYYVKKVNAEWFKHISGIIQGLAEFSAWQDTPEDVKRAIDEIHAFISKDWTVLENCEDVNDCLPETDIIQQMINQSTYIKNLTSKAQYDIKNLQFNQLSNKDIYKIVPADTPNRFAPNPSDPLQADILCDVMTIFVKSWQYQALEQINIALGITDASQTLAIGVGVLAGLYTATVGTFLVSGIASISGILINNYAGDLNDLKNAYLDEDGIDDVICAMIKSFAYRSIGYNSYLNGMYNMPALTTTPVGEIIADDMVARLANSLIPLQWQQAYWYMVELYECIWRASDPNGLCDSCLPTAPCGITPLRINMDTGSSSPLTPPSYNGSDIVHAQSPVSVWYIGIRDSLNSWFEYRVNSNYTDEICFYRIAGIWRANSASITGGKLNVWVDGVLAESFNMPNPLNTTFQSFNFVLSKTYICNTIRITVTDTNFNPDWTLFRNVELWRYV